MASVPPPPPPHGGGEHAPSSASLPPHLQAMMRQVVRGDMSTGQAYGHYDPREQNHRGRGGGRGRRRGFHSGGRGGRGRGRGRGGGRGGGGGGHYQNQYQHPGYLKRSRDFPHGPRDTARFFLPSFLEDPWQALLSPAPPAASYAADSYATNAQYGQEVIPSRPGRVLFQPSFLEDPWQALLVR